MSVQQPAADARLDLTEKTILGFVLILIPGCALTIIGCARLNGWL